MCRGLKPKTLSTGNVSKQELAEVCRRQSVDEKEEEGQEERMTGLGFMRCILLYTLPSDCMHRVINFEQYKIVTCVVQYDHNSQVVSSSLKPGSCHWSCYV